jgi:hypothetical protein
VKADTKEGLQRLMDVLSRTCAEYDVKINKNKTKVMKTCRCKGKEIVMKVDDVQLQRVEEFPILAVEAYTNPVIWKRIAMRGKCSSGGESC